MMLILLMMMLMLIMMMMSGYDVNVMIREIFIMLILLFLLSSCSTLGC